MIILEDSKSLKLCNDTFKFAELCLFGSVKEANLLRPDSVNTKIPTEISTIIEIVDIQRFEETEETMSLEVEIKIMWNDFRLSLMPERYQTY